MVGKKAKKNTKSKKVNWKSILNIFLILVFTFAVVVVAQLFVGYLMLWILGREIFVEPVPTAIYSALSYILALIFILFAVPKIITRKKLMGRDELGLRGWPTWTDIGLAPVGYIVSILAAAGLTALFNLFPWFDAEQAQEIGFNTYIVGFDRIVAFLILVVVAPIAEEIIFRGWLYGKLRTMLSEKVSEKASIIISTLLVSLIFGLVHMQWNVGVTVFAMSVVLCVMREITGTIYSGILMHMIRNGLAFYLIYVLGVA